MLKGVDSLMYFICTRLTKTIYVSKFQVITVMNIEVNRQNVFSHARVMVIGASSDLKCDRVTLVPNQCAYACQVELSIRNICIGGKAM